MPGNIISNTLSLDGAVLKNPTIQNSNGDVVATADDTFKSIAPNGSYSWSYNDTGVLLLKVDGEVEVLKIELSGRGKAILSNLEELAFSDGAEVGISSTSGNLNFNCTPTFLTGFNLPGGLVTDVSLASSDVADLDITSTLMDVVTALKDLQTKLQAVGLMKNL